jgi:ParB family chromosome partitioning protein
MDLTTVAHHLALLDLPAELGQALQTGRCTSPRTLYELSRLHAKQPEQVHALVTGEGEITRSDGRVLSQYADADSLSRG